MILSIIIPIYNEKKTISEILKRVEGVDLDDLSVKKEIIVVDDGSSDGTKEVLKEMEKKCGESSPLGVVYKFFYHEKNQGKGMAIRTGLDHVLGDYIIIQDADLEYDPQDYRKIIKYSLENNAPVVYGSRIMSHSKMSRLSFYLGGVFLTKIINILYGTKLTDEATCYKFFKTEIIKSFSLKCKRFEFCPEVTAKVAKRGIKIYEVPTRYNPRSKSEGKKIKWRDGFEALWVLIKYRFVD